MSNGGASRSIRSRRVTEARALAERAKTIPGVERAARALTVPFYMSWQLPLFVPGIDSVSKLGDFSMQGGTPEFFETMGTRILRGRGFATEDRATSPLVVVVSEAMAKKLWPNEDAIGKSYSRRTPTPRRGRPSWASPRMFGAAA